jgi:hypothetical protein
MAAQPRHNGLEAAPSLRIRCRTSSPSPLLIVYLILAILLFRVIVLRVIRIAAMTPEEGINDGDGGGAAPSTPTAARCCC